MANRVNRARRNGAALRFESVACGDTGRRSAAVHLSGTALRDTAFRVNDAWQSEYAACCAAGARGLAFRVSAALQLQGVAPSEPSELRVAKSGDATLDRSASQSESRRIATLADAAAVRESSGAWSRIAQRSRRVVGLHRSRIRHQSRPSGLQNRATHRRGPGERSAESEVNGVQRRRIAQRSESIDRCVATHRCLQRSAAQRGIQNQHLTVMSLPETRERQRNARSTASLKSLTEASTPPLHRSPRHENPQA